MNEKIMEIALEWTKEPYDESTRNEIRKIIDNNDEKELMERFSGMLEFGTGGMRGIIAAGTNRMNRYTVSTASQGLANYILKNKPDNAELSIAIAHDSRLFSREFSEEAASVFTANGIKTFLFSALRPTPQLSFAVKHLNCCSGIVVTASHNPQEYNGYKVYWSDGGQVVPPHDKGIIDEVKSVKGIKDVKKISLEQAGEKGLFKILGPETDVSYIKSLRKCIIDMDLLAERGGEIKIVYTPLHGTGGQIVPTALKDWGFTNVLLEPIQSIPDGHFPSVKSPNPEESAALERAVNLAKENDSDIVLATDPDADRVGIAVKIEPGKYDLLNGNQVGALLSYYILSQRKSKNILPSNSAIIKTIVTTDLITEIANKYNCEVVDVLTGFKYIAEKIRLWETGEEKPFRNFQFGTEESYGYLIGTHARDKDAVVTCCQIAEMALWAKTIKMSLSDLLNKIFKEFGIFLESQKSVTLKGLDGMAKIKRIMSSLEENPPENVDNKKVIQVDNIIKGIKIDPINKKEIGKIDLPKSNVIVLYLEDGSKIVARPSGTEPKIKFYFFISDKNNLPIKESDELFKRKLLLSDKMEALKKSFLTIIEKIG